MQQLETKELHDLAAAVAVELAALTGNAATPLLTAEQAATLLSVPASWVRSEARANRIPHVRFNRYVRFNRDDLLAWANDRAAGPQPRPPHTTH